VRDSHDRYANIEIDYLLTRMEAYRGLAVLATNLRHALDAAFTRRLRFIVAFPFPGVTERRRLWQLAFPPGVPQETLDWDRLARLNLTGATIHAVALNAAFLAASRGAAIDTDLVLDAVRTELRKLDRPLAEVDAG
jgi:SpoVK/Ycf46/Vps4 family AAA+-type ATPase